MLTRRNGVKACHPAVASVSSTGPSLALRAGVADHKMLCLVDFASLDFAPTKFFSFFAGRYSVDFAPPGVRNSLDGTWFGVIGGAIWSSFRPGGETLFGGEAK
ncbi:MAG: hypothetical protein WD669_12705 [Pirellulales bacterium]